MPSKPCSLGLSLRFITNPILNPQVAPEPLIAGPRCRLTARVIARGVLTNPESLPVAWISVELPGGLVLGALSALVTQAGWSDQSVALLSRVVALRHYCIFQTIYVLAPGTYLKVLGMLCPSFCQFKPLEALAKLNVRDSSAFNVPADRVNVGTVCSCIFKHD